MASHISSSATCSRLVAAFVLAISTALAGCASVAHTPAVLQADAAMASPAPRAPAPRALASQLQIDFDTGYSRTILAGSQWQRVGSIPQGMVYRPHLDVFTLEGAHIHEAYLVVDKDTLVGFYLPAERGFSPLKRQLAVNFK
jgi:hypothetical protein